MGSLEIIEWQAKPIVAVWGPQVAGQCGVQRSEGQRGCDRQREFTASSPLCNGDGQLATFTHSMTWSSLGLSEPGLGLLLPTGVAEFDTMAEGRGLRAPAGCLRRQRTDGHAGSSVVLQRGSCAPKPSRSHSAIFVEKHVLFTSIVL